MLNPPPSAAPIPRSEFRAPHSQDPFTDLDFPGRQTLNVRECAAALSTTDRHIVDLIESGRLPAVDIGAGGRHIYRVPVLGWRRYLREGVGNS